MTAEVRSFLLFLFRNRSAAIFQEAPEIRSVMHAIAQRWWTYGRVRGDDVYDLLVMSPREIPVWRHICEGAGGEAATNGERCTKCRWGYSPDYHQRNSQLPIESSGFLGFCHDSGTFVRDVSHNEDFLPYAIARRGDGGEISIEIVGTLKRPELDMLPEERESWPWLTEPQAPALYDLVCAAPDDDAPRRVLADYLLERGHLRGEMIALGLGDQTNEAVAGRIERLLTWHGQQWIGALGAVIPASGAHWQRGFLSRAHVFADGNGAVARGAPEWRTVEEIRFLGTDDVIDPAMTALRDVGPVRGGLRELAAAARPWAIERLHAALDEADWVDALWQATTLPRLTHLVLEGVHLEKALARPRPRWWPQLERLTLWLDDAATVPWLMRYAGIAPWVAVTHKSNFNDEPGWEIALGPADQVELSLAGWHERATRAALVHIAALLPRELGIALVPSRYWAPTAEDAAWLAASSQRIGACAVRSRAVD